MPVLGNFTLDSDFPAICRLPSISVAFEAPARHYNAYEEDSIVKDITIPPASIVIPAITSYQFTSPTNYYIDDMQSFYITCKVERTSATNMRATWHIRNKENISNYWFGNNYRIDIALFNVP